MASMSRRLLVIPIVLTLVACADKNYLYDKPNATAAQIDRDLFTCRKESTRNTAIAITPSQRIDREAFNRCMERKGYTVTLEK
jgi:hypothetical protein